MPAAVGVLIEIAALQKAYTRAGLPPLALPTSSELLKLAALNAGTNSTDPQLFPQALLHLAQHHLEEGEVKVAYDYAVQGLGACLQISSCNPELIRAYDVILTTLNNR